MSREDAVLCEWASSTRVAEEVVRAEAATPIAPARRASWRQRAAMLTGIAASIAAFALLVWQLPRGDFGRLGPVLATLEDVQGEVNVVMPDGRVELARSGQSLYAGQEVQTGEDDSSTAIHVRDARLTLASETHIRVGRDEVADSGPMFFISQGLVNADITRKPVVLRSAHAEMRGQSGKFSFISLPDSTFIESDDGLARLTRKSDGDAIDLKRGQFAVVKPGSEPLQSQPTPSRVTIPRRTIAVGGGPIKGVFFDPEGLSLVTCAGDSLRRWDLTGRAVGTIYAQKKRPIRAFAPSADGNLFAIVAEERQIKLLDSVAGSERWQHKEQRPVKAIVSSPEGRSLAAATGKDGHEVRLYDTVLGLERTLHTGHAGAVTCLAASPKGNLLATAGPDRSVRIWNANDLSPVRNILKLPAEPRSLAFSPDEHLLALGDRAGNIRIFDVDTGSEKHLPAGHLRDILALAFSPDGQLLASTSSDGMVRVWHVAKGLELAALKGHANAAASLAFSHDGRTLATGGLDKKVLLWDVPGGR